MADLDFDARRRERGQAEPHRVTVAGQGHELPPVPPTQLMVRLAEAISDATGGQLEGDIPITAIMVAAPKLIAALSDQFGDWVEQLDLEEVMAILGLYGIGGGEDDDAGEASAS